MNESSASIDRSGSPAGAPPRAASRLGPLTGIAPGTGFCASALRFHLATLPLPPRTRVLLGDAAPAAGGIEASADRKISRNLLELTAILRAGRVDGRGARDLARDLSGAGPGLTPTGDDLLVGLAAEATRLSRCGAIDRGTAPAFLDILRALPAGNTTPTASEMIRLAAAGWFPEGLAAVADTLGDPRVMAPDLAAAAAKLVRTGAHTGADMLAGVVSLARSVVPGGDGP